MFINTNFITFLFNTVQVFFQVTFRCSPPLGYQFWKPTILKNPLSIQRQTLMNPILWKSLNDVLSKWVFKVLKIKRSHICEETIPRVFVYFFRVYQNYKSIYFHQLDIWAPQLNKYGLKWRFYYSSSFHISMNY